MHSTEELILAIAAVVVLGVGAQWLAWRVRLPSILLLLALGFVAGPVSAMIWGDPLLDPDELMDDLLTPFVSISVALILYEGGLSLRFRELRGGGAVLWRLVTIGATVTWLVSAAAAWLLLDLPPKLAVLLGGILVVTGPTVIIPLLREIRPRGRIGAVVKWEGIVIDPIGAMLAVIVFEIIILTDGASITEHAALVVAKTVIGGGGIGVAAGLALALMLRAFWIPEFLENAVSLMLVVLAYTIAQHVQSESGLFAATAMGMMLANQRLADVRRIVEFKEDLRVLLIPSLFILLAARVQPETLGEIGWAALAFIAIIIVIVRPLSVLFSTVGSKLTAGEFVFLSMMAPRGIVAASVASVFGLRLIELQHEQARQLVPITFGVIVGTVLFSSLVTPYVARRMGVADASPQGLLIVGANAWARSLAEVLKKIGIRALLVDTNRENIAAARLAGLETWSGSILDEHALDEIDFGGIGRLLAATPNDLVNNLAAHRFERVFGRSNVYQLASRDEKTPDEKSVEHKGRVMFGKDITFARLTDAMRRDAVAKATPLTEEFTFEDYQAQKGESAIPLMLVSESKKLTIITDQSGREPKPGQTLISLVLPEPERT